MGLAIGILLIWAGCACLYVAAHGLDATTPWAAYQEVMSGIRDTGSQA